MPATRLVALVPGLFTFENADSAAHFTTVQVPECDTIKLPVKFIVDTLQNRWVAGNTSAGASFIICTRSPEPTHAALILMVF